MDQANGKDASGGSKVRPDPVYDRDIQKILEAEQATIRERRILKFKRRNNSKEPGEGDINHDLRGLALSGGGVRSASFAIGVMQGLNERGVMDRFDYMSTVSGGGYAGGALTWFLSQRDEEGNPRYSTLGRDFPFSNDRDAPRSGENIGLTFGRRNIDFIRQRSSYLEPGAGLTKLSAFSVLMRGTLISVIAYVFVFGLLFLFLRALGAGFTHLADRGIDPFASLVATVEASGLNPFFWIAMVVGLFLIVSWIGYSIYSAKPFDSLSAYSYRRFTEKWGGRALGAMLLIGLLGVLDLVYHYSLTFISLPAQQASASVLAALGTVGGFVTRHLLNRDSAAHPILMKLLPVISGVLLLMGFGLLAMALGHLLFGLPLLDIAFVALGGLGFCLAANMNNSGLHRMYRDRLMETFMPDHESVVGDVLAAQSGADTADLHDMASNEDDGPFHIVNTNLVLAKSQTARHRSRGGDSFVLTPLYSGSESTGWIASNRWLEPLGGVVGPVLSTVSLKPVGPMKLPTAIAISGAALNPRTGADGKGPTRGAILSFVLTILNLRLGYWVPAPTDPAKRPRASRFYPPNFLTPGLVKGLLGLGHNENSGWLELSDGGHFDNTGLYELIRRRVKVIVLVDGSADPETNFASFANAQEKALIDFDARITFFDDDKFDPEDRFSFEQMVRGSGVEKDDSLSAELKLAKRGFAVGKIRYSRPNEPGLLFYIKTSMFSDLPVSLYAYKRANPAFPDEPTSDQFFSEQQFEGYRVLGIHTARQMMDQVQRYSNLAEALGLRFDGDKPRHWPEPRSASPAVRNP